MGKWANLMQFYSIIIFVNTSIKFLKISPRNINSKFVNINMNTMSQFITIYNAYTYILLMRAFNIFTVNSSLFENKYLIYSWLDNNTYKYHRYYYWFSI